MDRTSNLESVWKHKPTCIFKKFNFFIKNYRFDLMISKTILKNKKNIILMYFDIKITLKNYCNHTFK